mgnify:CR=1 FL=1
MRRIYEVLGILRWNTSCGAVRTTRLATICTTVAFALSVPSLNAQVYGVKGWDGAQGGTAQWTLFRFTEDGTNFTVIGQLRIDNQPVQIDGLAISTQTGLLGFQISSTDPNVESGRSRLVRINPLNASITIVGDWFPGVVRAADFDVTGRLWALDAQTNSLLQVDPNNGSVLSSTVIAPTVDITNLSGLVFTAEGPAYLSQSNQSQTDFYIIDPNTAQVGLVLSDNVSEPDCVRPLPLRLVDMETSPNRPGNIFGLEVYGCDDIFIVGGSFGRSVLYSNIIPNYNGGPGDLAALLSCSQCPADVNKDGIIDDGDLLIILLNFGNRCFEQ